MMPMVEKEARPYVEGRQNQDKLPVVSPVSTGTDARKLMSSANPHIADQHVNILLTYKCETFIFYPIHIICIYICVHICYF